MRYTAELAARAEAWLARPLIQAPEGRRSAEGLLELATIWAATQGLPLPECIRQCQYSDRVHDLQAYLREYHRFTSTFSAMSDTQPTSTYQFKPEYAGQTLTADDYGKAVTPDNLTDEDAEHFIKKGFGHVFQKIGAAVEAVGEKLEGVGNGLAEDEDEDQPTEREQELQAQVEQTLALLSKEETDHELTTQGLEAVKLEYQKLVADYNTNIASLQSEKDAHAITKQQLSEVQQQLADTQKQLADATAPKAKKATAAPAGAGGATMTASTTPAAASDAPASDATTANTDGTNSDGSAATV